ncbi:TetR/AcrR family transcriptional regulator [Nonomuraea sp. KM88]|uniref:TetR/AcrR family transcriptional regulator n=1 Tax=Nonomuraea sp. KM88 TaxID=3457427 RepID=UPI003FCCCC92
MERTESGGRRSEARARLLDTATRLFYTEGINAVGIDRIVAEAQVTRATLYRHFPGKEDLILAYLNETDQAVRAVTDAAIAGGLPAAETVRAVGRAIAQSIQSPGFRDAPSSTRSPNTPTPTTRCTGP